MDIKQPLDISKWAFGNRTNATLYVPYGCKAAYAAANYWKEFKEIAELMPDNIIVTMPEIGISTYASTYPLDFTGTQGLKAYIASGFSPSTGELTLTRVTKVPAKEGLLLKGDAGNYEILRAETDMYYSNLLKGVATATTVSPTDGSYTNFILANGSQYGIGFYTLAEEGEIAAGKAYLQLPTSAVPVAETRGIKLVFDDEEGDAVTGVKSLSPTCAGPAVYNLNGQRVAEASQKSGIYVVGGKKVFVK